jgi:uncharacterized protein (DUF1015 family)
MATVRPFQGLRPRPDIAKHVASPPYDVIDSEAARKKAHNNPISFLHIIKPEIDLNRKMNPFDYEVYSKGAENLKQFIKQKVLFQEKKSCFYIYKQIMDTHEQAGLVACVSVDEYIRGHIKKHEHTRDEQVQDRLKLMQALNAQTGPALLAYKQDQNTKQAVDAGMSTKPVYDFVCENNIRHIFYVIDDQTLIKNLQSAFERIDALYIADGHHRIEAAAQNFIEKRSSKDYGEDNFSDYFLSVIFPESDLLIIPYNRVVKDLNNLGKKEFLDKLKQNFFIKEVTGTFNGPGSPQQFGLYLDNKWVILTPSRPPINTKDPVKNLDVSILQDSILTPILGIQDPRTDSRIKFIGGIDSIQVIEQVVDRGEFSVGFSLYPTTMSQVMRVADAGQIMPPKSTWFEPKLLSGLVTYLLE